MPWLYGISLGMLGLAGLLALWRLERGPSILDRVISVDVIAVILLDLTAIVAVMTKRTDLRAMLVLLTLIGFLSVVTICRFASQHRSDTSHILTVEQAKRIDEMRRQEEMRWIVQESEGELKEERRSKK